MNPSEDWRGPALNAVMSRIGADYEHYRRKPVSKAVEVLARDREIAEQAEREAVAQLEVIRALKPLSQEQRERVLRAICLISEADRLVPGIVSLVASHKGMVKP